MMSPRYITMMKARMPRAQADADHDWASTAEAGLSASSETVESTPASETTAGESVESSASRED